MTPTRQVMSPYAGAEQLAAYREARDRLSRNEHLIARRFLERRETFARRQHAYWDGQSAWARANSVQAPKMVSKCIVGAAEHIMQLSNAQKRECEPLWDSMDAACGVLRIDAEAREEIALIHRLASAIQRLLKEERRFEAQLIQANREAHRRRDLAQAQLTADGANDQVEAALSLIQARIEALAEAGHQLELQ